MVIDFDNTIVAYDRLFVVAARERELVPANFEGSKGSVRDRIRSRAGGEAEWQALQALVYGELIARAPAAAGFRAFVVAALERGVRIAIVSHKTEFATARPDGSNLRESAREWLRSNHVVGSGAISETAVYFESSRREKIERIRALGAQIVIDDLIDVFTDPRFPPAVRAWWFVPGAPAARKNGVERFGSWPEMAAALSFELDRSRTRTERRK